MADPARGIDPRPAERARYQLAAIGEVLWDVFATGPRFGGAPANFACSAAELGRQRVNVSMVGCVGRDDLGRQAIEALRQHGVQTEAVEVVEFPTGQVFVELDTGGSASYRFAENTAWDNLAWTDGLAALAERLDAVCFGTLGQRSARSRETIQRFVAQVPSHALRIFDINLRPPFYDQASILESLELANVLKLNDEELPLLAQVCQMTGSETSIMQKLAARFKLVAVALTRGERGAILVRDDQVSREPGNAATVVDTVGAGDAFTAAFALGLLAGHDLDEINQSACAVAAYVCSQSGATPEIPSHLAPTLVAE